MTRIVDDDTCDRKELNKKTLEVFQDHLGDDLDKGIGVTLQGM